MRRRPYRSSRPTRNRLELEAESAQDRHGIGSGLTGYLPPYSSGPRWAAVFPAPRFFPPRTQAGHGATGDGDGGRPLAVWTASAARSAKVPPASQWGHGAPLPQAPTSHHARPSSGPVGGFLPGPVAGAADQLCGLWALGDGAVPAVPGAARGRPLRRGARRCRRRPGHLGPGLLHRPGAHHGAGVEERCPGGPVGGDGPIRSAPGAPVGTGAPSRRGLDRFHRVHAGAGRGPRTLRDRAPSARPPGGGPPGRRRHPGNLRAVGRARTRSARAQAPRVAPVVTTSSTSRIGRPVTAASRRGAWARLPRR